MGCMLVDVINPIVELYPDLNHRSWNKRFPNCLTLNRRRSVTFPHGRRIVTRLARHGN